MKQIAFSNIHINERIHKNIFLCKETNKSETLIAKFIDVAIHEIPKVQEEFSSQVRLNMMSNPYVVEIIGWCGGNSGGVYVIMEKMNKNLNQLVEDKIKGKKSFSLNFFRKLCKSIFTHLETLFSMNLSNGNLKPTNIFKNETGIFKFSDIGISIYNNSDFEDRVQVPKMKFSNKHLRNLAQDCSSWLFIIIDCVLLENKKTFISVRNSIDDLKVKITNNLDNKLNIIIDKLLERINDPNVPLKFLKPLIFEFNDENSNLNMKADSEISLRSYFI